MTKRFTIARICIDTDGNYSCDIPQPEQGGSFGFGTVYLVPDSSVYDVIVLVQNTLLHPDVDAFIRSCIHAGLKG